MFLDLHGFVQSIQKLQRQHEHEYKHGSLRDEQLPGPKRGIMDRGFPVVVIHHLDYDGARFRQVQYAWP